MSDSAKATPRALRTAVGRAAERAVAARLRSQGFKCSRFVGSVGLFDLLAVRPGEIKLVQIKLGARNFLKRSTRNAIVELRFPPEVSTEFWRLPTLTSEPIIERPIRPPARRRGKSGVFTKPCAGCSAVIEERLESWLSRRRFCSRSCSNAATAAVRAASRARTMQRRQALAGVEPSTPLIRRPGVCPGSAAALGS